MKAEMEKLRTDNSRARKAKDKAVEDLLLRGEELRIVNNELTSAADGVAGNQQSGHSPTPNREPDMLRPCAKVVRKLVRLSVYVAMLTHRSIAA